MELTGWILIITMWGSNPAVSTAVFDTKEYCEIAALAYNQPRWSTAKCFPQGKNSK